MKSFDNMYDDLSEYLTCDRCLEIGFGSGIYTKKFASYCNHLDAIDISKECYDNAVQNLGDLKNVEFHLMDACKMEFPDKQFDLVISVNTFHEIDMSSGTIDLDLKNTALKEMIRLSDIVCFIEELPENLCCELFKVFNPDENHSLRIKKSNELIEKVMKENRYKVVVNDVAVNKIPFNSKEEMENEMLSWWSDIKTPSTIKEREQMINQINEILETQKMLTNLCFEDIVRYIVYKKED